MKKLLAIITGAVALAACSSTASHTATTVTSPAAKPTTPPVPALTADPHLVGMYLGQVTPSRGETVIAVARQVCNQDSARLARQVQGIAVPANWGQTGPPAPGNIVYIDLHGPGPLTVKAGQSYSVSIGSSGAVATFTPVNDNEGVCAIGISASSPSS